MVAIQPIHVDIADQHTFVFPGLTFKADVQMLAHEAAATVGGYDIPCAELIALVRVLQGSGHDLCVLLQRDELGRQFNFAAQFRKTPAQYLFHAPLRNDQHAGVRNVGCRIATLVHIVIAKHGRAVVEPKRQVKAAILENLFHHAKIVEDFQAARLQTFAARPREISRGFVDNSKIDSTACQLTRERKTGRACADDQNRYFGNVGCRICGHCDSPRTRMIITTRPQR